MWLSSDRHLPEVRTPHRIIPPTVEALVLAHLTVGRCSDEVSTEDGLPWTVQIQASGAQKPSRHIVNPWLVSSL